MSKEKLLETTFSSVYEAMYALSTFLDEVDESLEEETRGNYQNLRVIGNKIFE